MLSRTTIASSARAQASRASRLLFAWRNWAPLRVRFFAWLAGHGRLQTRNNLHRKTHRVARFVRNLHVLLCCSFVRTSSSSASLGHRADVLLAAMEEKEQCDLRRSAPLHHLDPPPVVEMRLPCGVRDCAGLLRHHQINVYRWCFPGDH